MKEVEETLLHLYYGRKISIMTFNVININKHKPTETFYYLSCVLSSVNRGRLLGSYDQHLVIRL